MRLSPATKRALKARKVRLLHCAVCGARYCWPLRTVSYEDGNRDGLKFYLEQGAGIGPMLAPLSLLDDRPISRYLEIGCAFGFSMDFARRILGWQVEGYDPGAIAEAGRRLLDLPIENRLFEGTRGTEDRAALVFCSEVIEHIPSPKPFMRLIRDALDPNGLLLMTTPNGDALHPRLAAEMMLPILSPGHHVVVYNARSLETLLRGAGFSHLRIIEDNNQLRVAASLTPFRGEAAYFTPALLRRYLAEASRAAANDALFAGLMGRLLKEDTNAGRYAEALESYAALHDAYRDRYAIDIDAPAALALPEERELTFMKFGERYPFNLTSVWYCRGIIALVAEHRPEVAARSFLAALRFGAALRQQLRGLGTDDLETAELCREAEIARLSALAQYQPAAAVTAFDDLLARVEAGETISPEHVAAARDRLFGDLVNLGHQDLAERVAGDATSPLEHLLNSGSLSGVLAWGLYVLNEKSDFEQARAIFARAWERALARSDNGQDLWFARFHQALASRYAGDGKTARSIAAELRNPPHGLPPVTKDIARRLHELIPTH